MNIERNCTYVRNLGLMLRFLGNLGLIHSHFNTVLRLIVCSVLFSYINRSKAGDCVQSQLKNLSRIKESRTFLKSFAICKTVSKLAVIYAPSLGCLWSGAGKRNILLGWPKQIRTRLASSQSKNFALPHNIL